MPTADEALSAAQDASLAQTIVGDEPLAEATWALNAHLVPGSPVETQADADARVAVEAERLTYPDTTPPEPLEYSGIDTTSPEANLATRSNIVSDGSPGTV